MSGARSGVPLLTLADIPKETWSAVATVISAVVGFTGVILTLNRNAKLAIRADKRKFGAEIAAADRKTAAETRNLRTALLAEMKVMLKLVESEIAFVRENTFTWIPMTDVSKVYSKNLERLGLLDQEQVEATVRAHGVYDERIGYVIKLGDPGAKGPGAHVGLNLAQGDNKQIALGDLGIVQVAANAAVSVLSKPAENETYRSPFSSESCLAAQGGRR